MSEKENSKNDPKYPNLITWMDSAVINHDRQTGWGDVPGDNDLVKKTGGPGGNVPRVWETREDLRYRFVTVSKHGSWCPIAKKEKKN